MPRAYTCPNCHESGVVKPDPDDEPCSDTFTCTDANFCGHPELHEHALAIGGVSYPYPNPERDSNTYPQPNSGHAFTYRVAITKPYRDTLTDT